MIDIKLQQLSNWLEKRYEHKYGDKLQLLKKTFFSFYNLAQQIISIYSDMFQQVKKNKNYEEQGTKEQLQSFKIVVNRTIIILHRLVQSQQLVKNKPGAINLSFCERFIKNFSENLNILCTYYHSLNHFEFLSDKYKYQKKKIVQGINKLYIIHNKIRQLYIKNDQDLKNIQNQKLYFQINIKHINKQKSLLHRISKNIYSNVEDQIADFYQSFHEPLKRGKSSGAGGQQPNTLDTAQQAIKKLMKNYFRILHQFYETQAQLQYYLKPFNYFCQQIKNKKKPINYAIIDSVNTFSRISSQLLKSNYSSKNLKKIRIQDFSKVLYIILNQILLSNYLPQYKESPELFGHKVYKMLGVGVYAKDDKNIENSLNKKQKVKQKQQKQKQRDKQKKGKQKQKQKRQPLNSHQKQPHKLNTSNKSRNSSKLKQQIDIQRQKYQAKNLKKQQSSGAAKINTSKQKTLGKDKLKFYSQPQLEQNQEQFDEIQGYQNYDKSAQNQKNKTKNKEKKTNQKDKNKQKNKQKQKNKLKQKQKDKSKPKQKSQQSAKEISQQQIQRQEQWQEQYNQEQDLDQLTSPEHLYQCETPQQKIQIIISQICECSTFIMDCMKQLQKVQNSGLMNVAQDYKQKLNVGSSTNQANANSMPNPSYKTDGSNSNSGPIMNIQYQNSKKLITYLCQYQNYIGIYYRLHENIKQFQKIARQIVLKEFNEKLNIIIDLQYRNFQLSKESEQSIDKSKGGTSQKNVNTDTHNQTSRTKSKRRQ